MSTCFCEMAFRFIRFVDGGFGECETSNFIESFLSVRKYSGETSRALSFPRATLF